MAESEAASDRAEDVPDLHQPTPQSSIPQKGKETIIVKEYHSIHTLVWRSRPFYAPLENHKLARKQATMNAQGKKPGSESYIV